MSFISERSWNGLSGFYLPVIKDRTGNLLEERLILTFETEKTKFY